MGPTATSRPQIEFRTHFNNFNDMQEGLCEKAPPKSWCVRCEGKLSPFNSSFLSQPANFLGLHRKRHVFLPHQKALQYKKMDQVPLTMRLGSPVIAFYQPRAMKPYPHSLQNQFQMSWKSAMKLSCSLSFNICKMACPASSKPKKRRLSPPGTAKWGILVHHGSNVNIKLKMRRGGKPTGLKGTLTS